MNPLAVDLSRVSQPERRRQERNLATLPQSFHTFRTDSAVIVIDGSDPDWPTHLHDLCRPGTLAVLVTPPVPASTLQVSAALTYAETQRIPFAIDNQWASHPGWDTLTERVRGDLSSLSLADVLFTTSPEDAAPAGAMLLDQIRCLDRVLPTHAHLARTYSNPGDSGHEVVADLAGLSLNLVGSPGPRTRMVVNLVGASCRWEIESDSRHATSRLTATRMDAAGSWASPDAWGSATRSTWQQLRTTMDGEYSPPTATTPFLRSLTRLHALTSAPQIFAPQTTSDLTSKNNENYP